MKRFIKSMVFVFCLFFLCFSAQTVLAKKAANLSNGVPETGLSGNEGSWVHYTISVPSGASNLVMNISGGSGDADLYTRFGSQSTSNNYDCRPYENGNNEECTVSSPQTGTYYVSLYAYSDYSSMTLVASYTGGGSSGDDLTNGVPVNNLSASKGNWLHYSIDVPSDSSNLEMSISGTSGDADLYTRFGSQPTSNAYDCRPYQNGSNEECTVSDPQAGTYYVSLYAFSTFSNITLEASYSDGGSPGDKTFIITAVQDDLNNDDMYDFSNGLIGLGYTKTLTDTNVYSSELRDYLSRNITTLYHTGHGNEGVVMTSDGSVSRSGTTLNVENTFFATCLTLTDTSWTNSFGSSAKTLMGYTKVSYDTTDETVAKNVIDELGNNRSYQMAWYLSNVGISSLNDRWAEYVREGSSIVEYSARTGNKPTSFSAEEGISVENSGRVSAMSSLATNTQTFKNSFGISANVDPVSISTTANEEGFGLLELSGITEQQAIAIAEGWLSENGGLPNDAVLDRVISIQRRMDANSSAEIVGYSVHYRRVIDGVKISGNYVEDHITLLVGSDSVIATSKYWPTIHTNAALKHTRENLLTVGEAISLAADEIASVVKGSKSIQLIDAEPVYGTFGPTGEESLLVPAFKVRSTDGGHFVIDAVTGELLL